MKHLKNILLGLLMVVSGISYAKSSRLKLNEAYVHKCSEKGTVCRVIMRLDHRAFNSLAENRASFDLFKDSIQVFRTRSFKVKKIRRTSEPNVVVAVLHASGSFEVGENNKYAVIANKTKLDIRYINRTQLSSDQKRWMNFDYSSYRQSANRYNQAQQYPAARDARPRYENPRAYRSNNYKSANQYAAPQKSEQALRYQQPAYTNVRHGYKAIPEPRKAQVQRSRKPLPSNVGAGAHWVEEEDVIFED